MMVKQRIFESRKVFADIDWDAVISTADETDILYIGNNTYVNQREYFKALRKLEDMSATIMGIDVGHGVYSVRMTEEQFEEVVADYNETECDGWEDHV
jgi:hypothetical protein